MSSPASFDGEDEVSVFSKSSNLSRLFAEEVTHSSSDIFASGSRSARLIREDSSLLRYDRPKEPSSSRIDSQVDTSSLYSDTSGDNFKLRDFRGLSTDTVGDGKNDHNGVGLKSQNVVDSEASQYSEKKKAIIIYSSAVQLFRWNELHQKFLQEKADPCGCVVVGMDSQYQLLIYDAKKQPQVSIMIDDNFCCSLNGSENYLKFNNTESDESPVYCIDYTFEEVGDRVSDTLQSGDKVGLSVATWSLSIPTDDIQNLFLKQGTNPFNEPIVRLTLSNDESHDVIARKLEKAFPEIRQKLVGLRKGNKLLRIAKQDDFILVTEIGIEKVKRQFSSSRIQEQDKQVIQDPIEQLVSTTDNVTHVAMNMDRAQDTTYEELLKSLNNKVDMLLQRKEQTQAHGSVLDAVENIVKTNSELETLLEERDSTIMELKLKLKNAIDAQTKLIEQCAQAAAKQQEAEALAGRLENAFRKNLKNVMAEAFGELDIDPEQAYKGKQVSKLVKNLMKLCYTRSELKSV